MAFFFNCEEAYVLIVLLKSSILVIIQDDEYSYKSLFMDISFHLPQFLEME